jgi:alkylhydroperoxidase family enzyme
MGLLDYTIKLLGLSETLHRWRGLIRELDAGRREKVARYADRIAETLSRAAAAFAALEKDPGSARAAREAVRELGRIAGYVEDIVRALEHHLDGRKLAGVKRRLDQLGGREPRRVAAVGVDSGRIERLLEAEGYFRSLADGLRT